MGLVFASWGWRQLKGKGEGAKVSLFFFFWHRSLGSELRRNSEVGKLDGSKNIIIIISKKKNRTNCSLTHLSDTSTDHWSNINYSFNSEVYRKQTRWPSGSATLLLKEACQVSARLKWKSVMCYIMCMVFITILRVSMGLGSEIFAPLQDVRSSGTNHTLVAFERSLRSSGEEVPTG